MNADTTRDEISCVLGCLLLNYDSIHHQLVCDSFTRQVKAHLKRTDFQGVGYFCGSYAIKCG